MKELNTKQFDIINSNQLTTIPPINEDLELNVLSAIGLNKKFNYKINSLSEECFYNSTRNIYNVFKKMFNEKGLIDISIAKNEVSCSELFGRDVATTSEQLDIQIKTLKELASKRKLQLLAYDIVRMIKENRNVKDIQNKILKDVTDTKEEIELTNDKIDEMFEEYLTNQNSPAIKTGYRKLDKITGGLLKGTMNLIASAQGIGKTSFVINVLRNICRQKLKVLFVSLEMTFLSLHAKLISLITGIEFKRLMLSKDFTEEEWRKIINARAEISEYKLYRLGEKEITVNDIRTFLVANLVDIVIIDYMQLIKPEKDKTLYENATSISRGLKLLSTQFDIPFLIISSINRDYSDRNDFTPRISDIRHSGQIEFDCDLIMLLHREAAFKEYDENKMAWISEEDYIKKAELIIAKNRFGEANIKIDYNFYGSTGLFEEKDEVKYEQQVF